MLKEGPEPEAQNMPLWFDPVDQQSVPKPALLVHRLLRRTFPQSVLHAQPIKLLKLFCENLLPHCRDDDAKRSSLSVYRLSKRDQSVSPDRRVSQ